MDNIDLRREFEKETGKKAVVINQYTYPTEQYFKWLEERLVKNLTMHLVINWVAIDDRLPKEHEDVLVYYYFNKVSRHFPESQFMMQTSFYDGKFECKEEVTHWAALPEPPCL
jgi:hypothetical protein